MERVGWEEDKSNVHVREKRLNERLKKWEKGDRLLVAGDQPTFLSSLPPSDDTPSPRNEMQSSQGGFPGHARGGVSPSLVRSAPWSSSANTCGHN